jgi:hypothetical protein
MPRRIAENSSDIYEDSLSLSLYDEVILEIFRKHYLPDSSRIIFEKDELAKVCIEHGITVRNIPDIIYTYRVRRKLPSAILVTGNWAIEPAGRGVYSFLKLQNTPQFDIPFHDYQPIEILNAIPEVVEGMLRQDEQSLLTKILYNRLIDIFTRLTCFHIQNHYRSYVAEMGEVEIDAIYVGVNNSGELFVIPIEAKSQGSTEMLGRIQIAQMSKLVKQDFPKMSQRTLAAKSLDDGTIAIVEFNVEVNPDDINIISVARYRFIRRGETTLK